VIGFGWLVYVSGVGWFVVCGVAGQQFLSCRERETERVTRTLVHSAVVHAYSLLQVRIVTTSTKEDVSQFLRQLAGRQQGKVQERLLLAADGAEAEGYGGDVLLSNLGNIAELFKELDPPVMLKTAEIGLIKTALSALPSSS
jgi:hypothetical protein